MVSVSPSSVFQTAMMEDVNRGLFMMDNFFHVDTIADAARTLFLGDLSYFCTEEDLCSLFSPYGSIITVRVRRGVTGESLMHGFIALDCPEAARKAIGMLDGVEFMGRNMRVQLSSDGQRPGPGAKEKFVQVHVSFISKQITTLITEKVLREIFAPFGEIADVAIKKHTTIQKQHRQSGYGFVYFMEADSAYRALHTLKHSTVRDITLDCSISHKSEHMIKQQMRYSGPTYEAPAPPTHAHAHTHVHTLGHSHSSPAHNVHHGMNVPYGHVLPRGGDAFPTDPYLQMHHLSQPPSLHHHQHQYPALQAQQWMKPSLSLPAAASQYSGSNASSPQFATPTLRYDNKMDVALMRRDYHSSPHSMMPPPNSQAPRVVPYAMQSAPHMQQQSSRTPTGYSIQAPPGDFHHHHQPSAGSYDRYDNTNRYPSMNIYSSTSGSASPATASPAAATQCSVLPPRAPLMRPSSGMTDIMTTLLPHHDQPEVSSDPFFSVSNSSTPSLLHGTNVPIPPPINTSMPSRQSSTNSTSFMWATPSVDEYGDGTPHSSFYRPRKTPLSQSGMGLMKTMSEISELGDHDVFEEDGWMPSLHGLKISKEDESFRVDRTHSLTPTNTMTFNPAISCSSIGTQLLHDDADSQTSSTLNSLNRESRGLSQEPGPHQAAW